MGWVALSGLGGMVFPASQGVALVSQGVALGCYWTAPLALRSASRSAARMRDSSAPKGRIKPAQGNALGNNAPE